MSTLPGDKSKNKRRSRIVVNVEDARGPAARGRPTVRRMPGARRPRLRNPRLLVPLAVIVLVLAALPLGGYLWWQSYKARPDYAIVLALDAARRDDAQAFDALVDVDAVSRTLVPQVMAQVRAPGGTQINSPQLRRQVEANAAVLLPGMREQFRAVLMGQIKAGLAQAGMDDSYFIVLALGAPRMMEIKETPTAAAANESFATATFKANGRPVELTLRRALAQTNANAARPTNANGAIPSASPGVAPPGGTQPAAAGANGWRIVGVKSDEVAARVAEALVRVYPQGR
ncbi:MAG TPA: hypothetical protein VF546_14740 [Pyrinomonadaceae bacterium]|jgi:hypothetical protein